MQIKLLQGGASSHGSYKKFSLFHNFLLTCKFCEQITTRHVCWKRQMQEENSLQNSIWAGCCSILWNRVVIAFREFCDNFHHFEDHLAEVSRWQQCKWTRRCSNNEFAGVDRTNVKLAIFTATSYYHTSTSWIHVGNTDLQRKHNVIHIFIVST